MPLSKPHQKDAPLPLETLKPRPPLTQHIAIIWTCKKISHLMVKGLTLVDEIVRLVAQNKCRSDEIAAYFSVMPVSSRYVFVLIDCATSPISMYLSRSKGVISWMFGWWITVLYFLCEGLTVPCHLRLLKGSCHSLHPVLTHTLRTNRPLF